MLADYLTQRDHANLTRGNELLLSGAQLSILWNREVTEGTNSMQSYFNLAAHIASINT